MRTKYFLVYLLSGSLVVISYAFFSTITTANKTSAVLGVNEFLQSTENQQIDGFSSTHSETTRVWPKLKFSWRVVVVTVIGFLGSALGTVVGVSGGGIFVPMFNLILGFDAKSSAALSKCTSSRAFCKAIQMWNQETIMKAEANLRERLTKPETVQIGDESQQLVMPHVKNDLEIICFNIRLKGLLVLMVVWISFLLIQITKNNLRECSPLYWALYILQFPLALSVFIYEAVKLWKEDRQRRTCGNEEPVCEASIEWTPFQLIFCAFCATLGGTVGGLLGSGAGFIMGPLLLELGVIPQVAAAFAMMFSSSLSVMELYFLKRFPIPYALYLTGVSIIAGFFGQYFVWKLVAAVGRASIIIFILSSVIFASALTMGIVGIDKSIVMIQNHEYMGFLSFCSSS